MSFGNVPDTCEIKILTPLEIENVIQPLIKLVQNEPFKSEIGSLQNAKELPKHVKSQIWIHFWTKIQSYVGGRLNLSKLNTDHKQLVQLHILLIPTNTDLLCKFKHEKNLHSERQYLDFAIKQKYCPINERRIANNITHRYLKCYYVKPAIMEQVMEAFSIDRAFPSLPF